MSRDGRPRRAGHLVEVTDRQRPVILGHAMLDVTPAMWLTGYKGADPVDEMAVAIRAAFSTVPCRGFTIDGRKMFLKVGVPTHPVDLAEMEERARDAVAEALDRLWCGEPSDPGG